MKSALHAQFLENCRAENIIPKGLQLRLKVNVGNNSSELQDSVDLLLRKVSMEICERIRDDHLRRSTEYGCLLEEVRNELKKKMSNADMFDLDCEINKQTETKRKKLAAVHEQKIRHMVNKKREENKSNKLKENTDATVLKTKNDDRPKQDSSPRNRRNNGWKSKGAVNRKEDKRIKISTAQRVADSKNTDNAELHHTLKTQSSEQKGDRSIPDDRATPSKNEAAPGPKKTYAEALSNGANVNLQLRISSLQISLDSLTKTVAQLVAEAAQRGNDRDVLSVFQTGKHGGRQKTASQNSERKENSFKPFIQASH
ncbi:hypothetical protein DPMN_154736 [Dreissena polymorpha]|uniref:Uncharacterized protein n=1 Tax=Dreissena polymorpha TaxID=45954 RepID=A0A9D4FN71_DREPO|nr:hypothetical protein DPMN_154736 [Dreissena polymorpha]